jgi:cysteine sulfinate desulfinase/cysteine desulfurase-like protein
MAASLGNATCERFPSGRVRRRFVIPADVYDTIHASSLLFDSFSSALLFFSSALLFRNATNNAIRLGSGWGSVPCRGGTLSAQSVMDSLGVPEGAVRVSISFYNTRDDIDAFIRALEQCIATR